MSKDDENQDDYEAELRKIVQDTVEKLVDIEKESKARGMTFHQQLTTTYGALGAITFGVLVFILQDQVLFTNTNFSNRLSAHQNFMLLVLSLSFVSVLSIFSALATGFAGAGIAEMQGPIGKLGYLSGLVAVAGLFFSLWIIVTDISIRGGDIFLWLTIGIGIVFMIAFAKELWNRRSP